MCNVHHALSGSDEEYKRQYRDIVTPEKLPAFMAIKAHLSNFLD
jgi:hypothetical protein